ncbi:MAG TPA: hypothetical protein VF198_17085 [Vicinamibacterales bacterium]
MLFSERSIWTMIHGVGLGGAALLGLAAALFYLYATRAPAGPGEPAAGARALAAVTTLTTAMLWLTVITGTYVIFPPYRVTPPAGATDLAQFPRAMLLANPGTAWLHRFAMESKEHMPWIASMLATAAAFVVVRHPSRVFQDRALRSVSLGLLAVAFVLTAYMSLLGVFVNKVAPLH